MLPESEYKRIKDIIQVGLSNMELCTEWDAKFLADFAVRVEKYKRHTLISPAQEEQFDRIEEYLRKEVGDEFD